MAYRVPFVNYPKHFQLYEQELMAAVRRVLSRGDLVLRDDVRQFERSIAAFLGMGYGVGLNSCTDALHISLLAAGINPGDEVITVAHTFVATVAVIVHCGAVPVLVDITEDYNMNVDLVEAAVTPRTRAIIPVHLNGRVCDMARLMQVAEQHNLMVIEDAAQALGATFDGRKAGSFGLTSCFSFYPAKSLGAYGDAGILVTGSAEIAERAGYYRDHGRQTKTDTVLFGFNSRLDNLQAAILNVKFKHLPQWIKRRREIARSYQQGLGDIPALVLPPPPEDGGRYYDTFQNYVIMSPERDRLAAYLEEAGVETLVSWPKPMHHQPALGLGRFSLPVTERISREVLSLPMYPELSDEQVGRVVRCIRDYYRKGVIR